jgi:STE24 endopeptidase
MFLNPIFKMSIKIFSILFILGFSTCLEAAEATETASAPDTINAKLQNFDPYAATQKYLDTLSPEKKKSSDSYFEGGYWLILWNMIAEILVAWIFLSLGISRWIKKIAEKTKKLNLQNLIYIAFYFLISYIITFPLNLYQGFFREHQYMLSNLNFLGWLKEEMISLSLVILFGSLIIMLIYIAIRKVRENWWVWSTLIMVGFLVIGAFIYPVFISPLFNHFKPLQEGTLKNEILAMARSNGVNANEVYQFDASKQSTRISANVSGLGSTIRISLNDNLLNKCTFPEIKAVMGHETGHYVMNHIYKSIILLGLVFFLGFYLVNKLYNFLLRKWGPKWNISGIADISGLPLFIVCFNIFIFFATPVNNNITRVMEIEADYFGLNIAREPDGAASVAVKLSEYRKLDPGPWEEIIFYDHPSGRTRIMNAMKWKAENLGLSNQN